MIRVLEKAVNWTDDLTVEARCQLLHHLQASHQLVRLFAAAAVHHIRQLLPDADCHHALDIAVAYANGLATIADLRHAYDRVDDIISIYESNGNTNHYYAALAASWTVVDPEYADAVYCAAHAAHYAAVAAGQSELVFQDQHLRVLLHR